MEAILNHFKTKLESITTNTGTEQDPVLIRDIKTAELDEGQLDDKVTLQLPGAFFDITDMSYSTAGENLGMADTEVTVRLAVRKKDATRYALLNKITKALVGTSGTNFGGILKETQRKVSYDDIFEYRITFGLMYFDESAIPQYQSLTGDDRPDANIAYTIRKPGK
ncbi:MAG TPA: hypothetical protein VK172_14800 [Lentimicrobium sp.]|nr:hypothetical protein [Bacteroidales bacterium]HLO92431.1 hypothetical protein [Lentimicrobium sp.]